MQREKTYLLMPAPLAVSLVLNLALAMAAVVAWRGRQEGVPSPAAVVTEKNKPSARVTTGDKKVTALSFRWQQLDAPDFATFVKNLRDVGCPEATIRDIVQGELKEIYAARREELRHQAGAGREDAASLQKLADEEASNLDALTRLPAGTRAKSDLRDVGTETSPAAAAEVSTAVQTAGAQPGRTMLTPAAFLVGNDPAQAVSRTELSTVPTDARLNPATAKVIGGMREGFGLAIADAAKDAASPEYRRNWLSAQRINDETFSSIFGGDAFVLQQIKAMQAQHASGK